MPEFNLGSMTMTKSFEQLGVLLLDGSGSMRTPGETGNPKAVEVGIAARDLISRLKKSFKRDNLYLSIVMFDQNIEECVITKPVIDIDETADYNPLNNHGGETAIGYALEKAFEISDKFLSETTEFRRTAVIILMTDGQNSCGCNPLDVANKIKSCGKPIAINAVGYGKDAEIDKTTLDRIISISGGKTIYPSDQEFLRTFFV